MKNRQTLIWKKHSIFEGFINFYNQHGLLVTIEGVFTYLWRQVLYAAYPIYSKIYFDKAKKYIFQKRGYQYCLEKYNLSWRTERMVEIPIFQKLIRDNSKLHILEIGNVLKHYESSPKSRWAVVDKYEIYEGVINRDIFVYNPKEKFDLIVSISTIEHIGMEDGAISPNKAKQVINWVRNNLLNAHGRFIITIPIGYNKHLDKQIFKDEILFAEKYYMTRLSKLEWVQTSEDKVSHSEYGRPYTGANALFIGIIRK